MLNVAIRAARAAGAIINRAALDIESVRISQKQVNDFVTEIDHASEDAIIDTLLTAYPDHAILGEETGADRLMILAIWTGAMFCGHPIVPGTGWRIIPSGFFLSVSFHWWLSL